MNIEIFLSVLAALCAFRALEIFVSPPQRPSVHVERGIKVKGVDELPDFVKEALIKKLKGEDDDQ